VADRGAYNLNTGEIAWQVPTGPGHERIRNHPALKGLNLPALGGQAGQGGPLVTRTLLVFGLTSAGMDEKTKTIDPAALVAYDKAIGVRLGAVALPATPLGTPMTYAVNGRQFIAVTLTNGTLVSLALPRP
jgi:quinoprotein glucose dehydrogenase